MRLQHVAAGFNLRYHFEWQKGYGAFSVSYSQVSVVQRYVRTQEEHHSKRNFEEELIAILNAHEIPFEHRYLFEAEHHG
jgi:putative transposase